MSGLRWEVCCLVVKFYSFKLPKFLLPSLPKPQTIFTFLIFFNQHLSAQSHPQNWIPKRHHRHLGWEPSLEKKKSKKDRTRTIAASNTAKSHQLLTWGWVNWRLRSKLIVKVWDVISTLKERKKRRRKFFVKNILPFDSCEKTMLLHGHSVLFTMTQAFFHVSVEQLLEDVLGVGSQVILELQLSPDYPICDSFPVVVLKQMISNIEHFEFSSNPPRLSY